jgi:3'-5' exoribonuclease
MAHKFINEINPGETVDDVYLIKEPVLRPTTRGDQYIAMFICDKTGQLNGRIWKASEEMYSRLPKPGFVHIQGRSEVYQNNLQIVVNNVSVIDSGKVNVEDFLARTDKDVSKIFAELKQMTGAIKNKQVKTLVDEFLGDEPLMKKFKSCPGGMSMHHDFVGGLLEHTWNMMRVATAILPLYPDIQTDLVLAGIFIHDMGKTEELVYDTAFSYTDSGQLIGHITKTVLMLHKKADALAAKGVKIDGAILDALGHIILSHHGQYEFGSPKLPATAEAFMVCYIDDLDAQINQVTRLIEQDRGESNWTGWQKPLETKLYRKRIDSD